ncbi:MAG: transcription termination factor NusA [Verrucomicrobia bacterium GWF2_51_19]|nr:MAG: transcription termination factor NusA [Verrucomicrobia bacterium GWF2_51_19]
MSNELLSVLEYMEKEKGIQRAEMIDTIIEAIKGAAQKGFNAGQEMRIEINPKTGALRAWAMFKVVDSVSDPAIELHFRQAKEIDPNVTLGGTVEKEIDPSFLGRIAAQSARQAIMQRIRQFEKARIYDDYKDSIGDIISGVVRRKEKGIIYIDLGKAEAMLMPQEMVPGEDYGPGERIRCLLLEIENTSRGPELVLSRSHPQFVRKLFELEVSEIADGTVVIERLAREAGYRSKVAVRSTDSKVDPVGACVGARGARVKSIVRELGGEKVDIVHFDENPKRFLEEAIKPAMPLNIQIDELNHRLYFEVSEKDLSIAVGKRGQNARLTSRLLGWRLDINKEEKQVVGFEQRKQKAVAGLHLIPGINDELAKKLVTIGITSPDAFEGVTAEDLTEAGLSPEESTDLLRLVADFLKQ